MGGEGWPVEGVAHPLRGRGQTTGAGLPRKALTDGAHTLAEAGPVIPRWGAEAVGWEEGVPEPGSRGSRQTKQVLCALCRAPAATARGAPGAARRDPGLRPRRSLEHRGQVGPLSIRGLRVPPWEKGGGNRGLFCGKNGGAPGNPLPRAFPVT